MNSQTTNESNSVNMIRCPLCEFGCTNSFPQNQLSKHWVSEEHKKTVVKYICSENIKCEDALLNLAMIPSETDEPSTSAVILVDSYRRLMEQLTNVIVESVGQSNLIHAASTSNGSPNLEQIYHGTESPSRTLLEQMDRNPNHEHDLELHRAELELNTTAMNSLSDTTATSSTDGPVNHHMRQNQGPMLANEQQNTVHKIEGANAILRTELDSMPVSTDSCLIWYIDDIFKKIDDAISGNKPFIDSPAFQTAMHGHRLWCRLHLAGITDHKSISLHVHLNFPVKDNFSGTINFVLVDQSPNKPLKHIRKYLNGEIKDVNGCLGFNHFIDKNFLHQAENRYILNDSICLLVYNEQTIEQKFANLPENVRDALMSIQQIS